jgi:peptidyl-prolyl cis-trans isomerase B (cyclophilin B)
MTTVPTISLRPHRGISRGVLFAVAGLLTTMIAACTEEDRSASSPPQPAPVEAVKAGPVEAIVHTSDGDFRIELRPDVAPVACASFVNLVQRGFYDGLEFYRHSRVIRQAGNPWNDETRRWECGYRFMPEFSPDLRFDRGGMVALTKLADDDASPVRPNEFFVTTKPQSERFTFKYPIFAVVVDGQDVVNAMQKGARIDSIELVGDPAPLLAPYATAIASWNESLDAAPDPRRATP